MEKSTESSGQTILLIDPNRPSRDKGQTILQQLGYVTRTAAEGFDGLALIDGASAVIAAHPTAAELYPRLRAARIPLIASFAARMAKPESVAEQIGADSYLFRPYKKEAMGMAIYAAVGARLL